MSIPRLKNVILASSDLGLLSPDQWDNYASRKFILSGKISDKFILTVLYKQIKWMLYHLNVSLDSSHRFLF